MPTDYVCKKLRSHDCKSSLILVLGMFVCVCVCACEYVCTRAFGYESACICVLCAPRSTTDLAHLPFRSHSHERIQCETERMLRPNV